MAKGDKLPVVMGREKAVPGGVATLGADGILAESQRPTITAGDNITLKQEGSNLEIGAVVPGKSLIINGDFRKPVNRNGKGEYTSEGYTIDGWFLESNRIKLSVEAGFIRIYKIVAAGNPSFKQTVDNPNELSGKTITLSILYKSNCSANFGFYLNDSATMKNIPESDNWNVESLSVDLPENISQLAMRVPQMIAAEPVGSFFDVKAAILEEGDHQTHFRQNENGQWEIIDPIDYDTQYLLCSQYSPITGEWVGSQHVNENLLDNSYWALLAAIVNQKNKTTYGPFSTSKQITIDRWFIQSTSAYITLNETDQCLDLHTGTVVSWDGIEQAVDLCRDFIGKQLTLSALLRGEVGKQFRIAARVVNGGFSFQTSLVGTGNWELATLTFTVPENITNLMAAVAGEGTVEDKTISIKACQLEPGPISTLAHKEGTTWILNRCRPDKALELEKCQRYQVIFDQSSIQSGDLYNNLGTFVCYEPGVARLLIALPQPMRTKPTISFSGIIPLRVINCVSGSATNLTSPVIANILLNQNLLTVDISDSGLTVNRGDFGWIDLSHDSSSKLIVDANS